MDVGLVDLALSLCQTIYKMAVKMKSNKERCHQIAQRVQALEGLVLNIKQRGPSRISASVKNALRELCSTLDSATTLMEKFSKSNAFMSFVKSSNHEDKFHAVDKRLTDNYQVLSAALLIEQGNTLHKVYKSVSRNRNLYTRPTAAETFSSTMPPVTTSGPTTSTPVFSTMPPMSPGSLTPFPCIVPPSMPLHGTVISTPFSTTVVSNPVFPYMPSIHSSQNASALTNYSCSPYSLYYG
ncbi:uncharacterized protein LOC131972983 [Centropristis striata]|uniref:uncharacterized protein LOC131972983 n=1 Tax=Centropristis striata TaxID=184440 RepID=UPI0027E0398C|nr:uncharacterized protein LOC131972983 [Centropristis striata]